MPLDEVLASALQGHGDLYRQLLAQGAGRVTRTTFLRLVPLILAFLLLSPVNADTFTGQVVRILDGDTVDVLVDRTPQRVRLTGIDAPEKAQPFGTKAKQALADLAGGQEVQVDWHKKDRYGRTVGKILVQSQDANLSMVSAGLAWWYRQYAGEQSPEDRTLYDAAEAKAKTGRLGLWVDPNPMPPWEFRHQPAPVEDCPCDSSKVCTGPKGGRFCVTEDGKKRYQ